MSTATKVWREQSIELPTGKVHVVRGGNGPPLVLLHQDTGSPGWVGLHEELANDFTIYAPDLPGFGQSDRLDWARHPRDFATVLQATLNHLELMTSVTLVGLGFGGWVAAEMAVNNEARLERLVLVGAMGIKPPAGEILDQMLIDFPEYVKAGFATPEGFVAHFGEEEREDQILIWDYAREVVARVTWKPYMYSQQLPHLLRNLGVPTTVIWGEDDRIVPISAGQEFARLIPGAQLEVLAGTGHWVDLEHPSDLAALVGRSLSRVNGLGLARPTAKV